ANYVVFPDAGDLLTLEEDADLHIEIKRKEFSECHGHAIQHFLQAVNGWAYLPLFNHGNGAVWNAGAFGQLSLRPAVQSAHDQHARTYITAHGESPDSIWKQAIYAESRSGNKPKEE